MRDVYSTNKHAVCISLKIMAQHISVLCVMPLMLCHKLAVTGLASKACHNQRTCVQHTYVFPDIYAICHEMLPLLLPVIFPFLKLTSL